MPAYSFQKQFAEPILAGTKGGTIRATRRMRDHGFGMARRDVGGHARPGERLMLYTGMRTKHCRKIAEKTCLAVEPIWLDLENDIVLLGPEVASHGDPRLVIPPDCRADGTLDLFARFDGFADWPALVEFWSRTHSLAQFDGWHIRWLPLPTVFAP